MKLLHGLATRSRVEGLVILLVAVGYMWEAHNVPEFYQLPGVPGPTTFPYLLGVAFAACGLWLMISPSELVRRLKAAVAPSGPSERKPIGSASELLSRISVEWHLIAMWAAILAYLWFMPDIGFPITTVLLLAAFVSLLGEKRWPVVIGLALVTTAVIFMVFKCGLNVRLPVGILDALAK